MNGGEPLMHLRGSVIGNNRWLPNELSIYEDRVEEKVPARFVGTAVMGKHDKHVIRYEQVAAVGLHTGLKWSTLTVESTGGHTAVVKGLPKKLAVKAKELIEERLVAHRDGRHAVAPAPVSTADELSKLAALRDSGVLSDEEFASAKRQLLGPSGQDN